MRTVARDAAGAAPPDQSASGVASMLALLRDPNYRCYWLATVPWNLGRWTEIVVAGWMMLELTNSPWQVALLGFCRSAALPVIGPFAGVIADRVDRLTLIRAAQVLNVITTLALVLLIVTDQVTGWHLLAGSLLLGLSWGLDWPARRALMLDIVGQGSLVQATVLDNFSMNTSKIIGPALAGVLLALGSGPLSFGLRFGGGALGFGLLLIGFSLSLVLFWLVRRPAVEAARVGGAPLRSLANGLVYVVRHRTILGVLTITVLMNLLIFPFIQLLPVMARDELRVGTVELGWLAAADAIGALVGLPLILRLRAGGPHGWVYILGSAGMAASTLLFAGCPWYWPALLLLIVGGLGHAGFGTMQGTILLTQTTPEMRGRVLGVLTLAIGASPFGALLMGVIAERGGAPLAIGVCAAAGLVTVALVGWLVPSLRTAGRTSLPGSLAPVGDRTA